MKFTLLLFFLICCLCLPAQEVQDTVAINIEEIIGTDAADVPEELTVVAPEEDASLLYSDTIIKWMSIEEAEAAQSTEPRKIFVDVYASWCRWCRLSDSIVFRNREICHFINQNYYPVKFNGECKTPVAYKGKKYNYVKESESSFHELTSILLKGNFSYPGYAVLDERSEVVSSSNGYLSPSQIETLLHYYATGAYLETGYPEYEKSFIGKISE